MERADGDRDGRPVAVLRAGESLAAGVRDALVVGAGVRRVGVGGVGRRGRGRHGDRSGRVDVDHLHAGTHPGVPDHHVRAEPGQADRESSAGQPGGQAGK